MLSEGKIIKSGGKELAIELEEEEDMIGSNDSFISNLQKKDYNADLRSR